MTLVFSRFPRFFAHPARFRDFPRAYFSDSGFWRVIHAFTFPFGHSAHGGVLELCSSARRVFCLLYNIATEKILHGDDTSRLQMPHRDRTTVLGTDCVSCILYFLPFSVGL